jgi:beta-lactamase class A
MRRFLSLIAIMAAMTAHGSPAAQTAPAPAAAAVPAPTNEALARRAADVVALINGGADPASLFAPAFLQHVPVEQVQALVSQMRAQYGAARRVGRIEQRGPNAADFDIEAEHATIHARMSVAAQAPNLIEGLLITGADPHGDTADSVAADIRALPGEASLAIARLADGVPERLAGVATDRPMAIGSAFKLFILAELDRQIRAGERHWDDVVALDRHSLPSGVLQGWPLGSPVTLHSLATLMISISDNTAADMLLHVVGRENVERMMETMRISTAARDRPFLSTLETFRLKTAPQAAFEAWRNADEAGKRALLASTYAGTDPAGIDPAVFSGGPVRLDIEWYASADDLVRTLDWLRRNADEGTRAILAVNPGNQALRTNFAYVGYKGGSEPGVLNISWLVRAREGSWYAVTGSWNNPAATVDEARFLGLMTRAVQLVRTAS